MGLYLGVVVALVGAVALGAGAAYQSVAATPVDDPIAESPERTRISINVESARAIRAALAKPIVRPEPLPPITATLANPGPRTATAERERKPVKAAKRPKLSNEALNAMAMDVPQPARANLEFDRHKVY